MFTKYGEFDSYEEINTKAQELLYADDQAGLKALAVENGMNEYVAEDYIDGIQEEFCSALMAASGKLKVEQEDLGKDFDNQEIFKDWVEYIYADLPENEELCRAVRSKNKNLIGCLGHILKYSFNNCYSLNDRIVKAANINAKVKLGIPGSGTVRKLIKEYYLGKKA